MAADVGEDTSVAWNMHSSAKSFVVVAESDVEKNEWMFAIRKVMDQNQLNFDSTSGAAPVWVKDTAADECALCQCAFGLLTRRHHCRRCGCLCCADCSQGRRILAQIDAKELQRVCNTCKQAVDAESAAELWAAKSHAIANTTTTRSKSASVSFTRASSASFAAAASPTSASAAASTDSSVDGSATAGEDASALPAPAFHRQGSLVAAVDTSFTVTYATEEASFVGAATRLTCMAEFEAAEQAFHDQLDGLWLVFIQPLLHYGTRKDTSSKKSLLGSLMDKLSSADSKNPRSAEEVFAAIPTLEGYPSLLLFAHAVEQILTISHDLVAKIEAAVQNWGRDVCFFVSNFFFLLSFLNFLGCFYFMMKSSSY
jgi:hypothetical protein